MMCFGSVVGHNHLVFVRFLNTLQCQYYLNIKRKKDLYIKLFQFLEKDQIEDKLIRFWVQKVKRSLEVNYNWKFKPLPEPIYIYF